MCGGEGTAMCGEPRVAAECTYTEREFGRCSRPTVRPGRNVNDERDHGDGRWYADAGRPTRFKPSSPSPTDAVRDGSAKLGHPVQNVTREHGLTPLPR